MREYRSVAADENGPLWVFRADGSGRMAGIEWSAATADAE